MLYGGGVPSGIWSHPPPPPPPPPTKKKKKKIKFFIVDAWKLLLKPFFCSKIPIKFLLSDDSDSCFMSTLWRSGWQIACISELYMEGVCKYIFLLGNCFLPIIQGRLDSDSLYIDDHMERDADSMFKLPACTCCSWTTRVGQR